MTAVNRVRSAPSRSRLRSQCRNQYTFGETYGRLPNARFHGLPHTEDLPHGCPGPGSHGTLDHAEEYLAAMKKQKRYQRDIY